MRFDPDRFAIVMWLLSGAAAAILDVGFVPWLIITFLATFRVSTWKRR